jgi:hypothetical protein
MGTDLVSGCWELDAAVSRSRRASKKVGVQHERS